ncbi:MAG: CDP-diacylglycerol--glycerol-3-phosphate 3-phosphatidyltransferase [Aristaeellaceae bacterium]
MSKVFRKYTQNIWNVPNVLTMLRLALIPVFVVLFVAGHDKLSLLVFMVASFTDLLDGYLARKHHQITAFGKLMDPLADKLMVVTALICQGVKGVFPWQAITIVMLKELVMIVGGVYMLHHDIVVYSNIRGKLAQFSFILALILSFWHSEFVSLSLPLDRVVLWVAVVLALIALVDYSLDAYRKLRALYLERKQS